MKTKNASRRTTVYIDADIHDALRLWSMESDLSISMLINKTLREALSEDAADLDNFLIQQEEKHVPYEEYICDLRRRGRI